MAVVALIHASGVHAATDAITTSAQGNPAIEVTRGMTGCPSILPAEATQTEAARKRIAHGRIERGTSCFQSGRCRLPSAYDYDREIIPRVKKALTVDTQFASSSIHAEGSRRWVWLRGCVPTRALKARAADIVRNIDDVQHVINELQVLPRGPAPTKRQ